MNDHRKSRLRQLATGVALVSASTLADVAPPPKPDKPYTNSPKPLPKPPTVPVRINSPPDQGPPPVVDAGVEGPQPGPTVPLLNSPNPQRPAAPDAGTPAKKKP
jgi:hypothetical protein